LSNESMMIALIHWRIRPDEKSTADFLTHWNTRNSVQDRSGLIAEFLSGSLPMSEFPYITWHLDAESLGNFKSFVTVGLWQDAEAFRKQIACYFNDTKPMLPFEKYRRRRVVFKPVGWRIGDAAMPVSDSIGVT
jgi:hypothetical protein